MADISKIDMNRINGLIDKFEEVINKLNMIRYIVEEYHSGTQWYKIWSDGWIEQGGYVINPSSNETVNLLKPYTIILIIVFYVNMQWIQILLEDFYLLGIKQILHS